MTHEVVFLFDVDNTLLDNDRVSADLKRHLTNKVGAQRQARYWAIFEELRASLGYADYLGALQRYRMENPREPHLLTVSEFLINYPFAGGDPFRRRRRVPAAQGGPRRHSRRCGW